jgi:DNA-binding winged helix-turn-helix (wHTH) protein
MFDDFTVAQLSTEYSADDVRPLLAQTEFALSSTRCLIGRLPDCDLPVGHRAVSRQHAQIVCEAGRYHLEDLGSTNGTFLNGQQIEPHDRRSLKAGDLIQIAHVAVFRFEDPSVTTPITRPQPHLSGRFWLDRATRQVYVRGRALTPPLSAQQFTLLEILSATPGRVVLRDEIANALWPEAQGAVSEAMIDNLMARLRQRLGAADGSDQSFVETVRGVGFRFTGSA